MRRLTSLCFAAALSLAALHADVTLRYKTNVQMNSSLPPQMTEMATKGFMNGAMPMDTALQFKGGKGYTNAAMMTSIVDFTKQEITLIDKDGKRFATVPAKDFAEQMMSAMPAMPEQAKQMMAAMKSHASSKTTGVSATIAGIDSEERQMEITIDAPPIPNVPEGPMMRMVLHIWTAKASEVMKQPAVRELTGYNLYSYATMNPVSMIEKAFQQMPGFTDAFATMVKELQSGATPVMTRMQMEMYMPMLAAMAKANPQAAAMFGNFDASQPLMTLTQDIAELSTAVIPDSVFQIPEGYKSVDATEILKGMFDKAQKAGADAAASMGAPKK